MKAHRTYLEWMGDSRTKFMVKEFQWHKYGTFTDTGIHHTMGASTIMIKKPQLNSFTNGQKKTPIILTARMSPFRNYRISKDYRNPSYHRSFHNYDQINHNWIHLRMAENTSHHVNCTDVTLPQLWISTDYRNPSYHGSFHNYDHYEWPKRTLII